MFAIAPKVFIILKLRYGANEHPNQTPVAATSLIAARRHPHNRSQILRGSWQLRDVVLLYFWLFLLSQKARVALKGESHRTLWRRREQNTRDRVLGTEAAQRAGDDEEC